MTDKPILEVRHLSNWYRQGGAFSRRKRKQLLKDVSFTMYEGEIGNYRFEGEFYG